MADRTILSLLDSIQIYAAPYARRESVYHTQMPLTVALGTPPYVANTTKQSRQKPEQSLSYLSIFIHLSQHEGNKRNKSNQIKIQNLTRRNKQRESLHGILMRRLHPPDLLQSPLTQLARTAASPYLERSSRGDVLWSMPREILEKRVLSVQ